MGRIEQEESEQPEMQDLGEHGADGQGSDETPGLGRQKQLFSLKLNLQLPQLLENADCMEICTVQVGFGYSFNTGQCNTFYRFSENSRKDDGYVIVTLECTKLSYCFQGCSS